MDKIVAYDVYDRKGYWMTGYSTDLEGNPLEMAKMTLKYHSGGCIKQRYESGKEEQIIPKP